MLDRMKKNNYLCAYEMFCISIFLMTYLLKAI